jgi:ABC-type phosphonate transport system ATPase subunit
MIEALSLTKVYGGKAAVDGIDFQVKPGVVTGFLGPNGAGKTTTMYYSHCFSFCERAAAQRGAWFPGCGYIRSPPFAGVIQAARAARRVP